MAYTTLSFALLKLIEETLKKTDLTAECIISDDDGILELGLVPTVFIVSSCPKREEGEDVTIPTCECFWLKENEGVVRMNKKYKVPVRKNLYRRHPVMRGK